MRSQELRMRNFIMALYTNLIIPKLLIPKNSQFLIK